MTNRFAPEDCLLIVVDIQERLMPQSHEHARVSAQCAKLIEGAKIVGIPIVWTEQYRKGLGDTTPEIKAAIGAAAEPIEKMHFGCLDDEKVRAKVSGLRRNAVVLCGIEAHICVTQTALRAMEDGLTTIVAEDAISSRRPSDKETAVARLRQAGAVPASVEMLLMEWLNIAGGEKFKQVLPLLKS